MSFFSATFVYFVLLFIFIVLYLNVCLNIFCVCSVEKPTTAFPCGVLNCITTMKLNYVNKRNVILL